jgi:multiple sugar transport system ATP-binding protein
MASISLDRVSKRFGDVVAVRDLSLEIEGGELLVLVGPSGCGKTTVLRLIAGLETPDTGSIRFDGQDMDGVPPRDRNIAMVFEGYALYPHMAVRDNLAFALRLRKIPAEEVSQRVAEVASAMELEGLLGRRPRGLATGEAQHVAVGRAVIREAPEVLLLDDALSHLDAQQRLEARAEVGRLHGDLRSTIVAVTHDQAEALAVGTRVAVMDDGVLMQAATPQQLYERPANVFVAGFIGSPPMNLIQMELEHRDGRDTLRRGPLELPAPPHAGDAGGSSVTVGIRPEDIRLVPAVAAGEIGFRGHCDLVEYLGSRLLVHLRVGDDEMVALDDPADDIHAGDDVDCSTPSERLRLFDTATGRTLEVGVPQAVPG